MTRKAKPVSAARTSKTLFEAMSRAPQVQSVRNRPGLSSLWQGKPRAASGPVVAQPLSEQEAMEELAARQAETESRRVAEEQRRAERIARQEAKRARAAVHAQEKKARREARAAQKAAARAARIQAGGAIPKLSLSLSTPACLGIVGLVCAVVLAAFSLGRHSKSELGTVAAIKEPAAKPTRKAMIAESVRARIPANSHPDLTELLKKPEPIVNKGVMVNEAVSVSANEPAAPLAEDLNYLQIESFLVTRDRNGDQLAADLTHARKFLLDRGMKTFARKRSNGYALFCEQGVAPGKDHASERETLRKKVQQLGQEYRASGGLYAFKGCLFVSFASTKTGDPV